MIMGIHIECPRLHPIDYIFTRMASMLHVILDGKRFRTQSGSVNGCNVLAHQWDMNDYYHTPVHIVTIYSGTRL